MSVLWMLTAARPALAGPPDLTTFKDVQWETYVHSSPAFTLQYPYAWRPDTPALPGQIAFLHGAIRLPAVSVSRLDRPAGLTLADSALRAAQLLNPKFVVESQRDVKLGAVPARVVVGRWNAPLGAGIALRSLVVSAFVEQHWMIVYATDGQSGSGVLPELEGSALSIRFGLGRDGS